MESPELCIIRKYASEVKEAVANCASVHKFADKLVEKEFISLQLQSDILYHPSSPLEKSGRLIDAVRSQVKLNPSNFGVFINILEEQSPLKSLAAQLKQDYAQSDVLPDRPRSRASTDSSDSTLAFSVSSLETKWALLIVTLTEILSGHENALIKMKTAFEQRVRSKPVGKSGGKLKKFNPVVASPEYKEAKAINAFFNLLAPFWNWKEYSLLEFLVEASGCESAIEKLQEFIESRKQEAPFVVLQLSPEVEAKPGQTDGAISPLSLPGSLVEQSTGDPRKPQQKVLVLMKVKKDVLTLEDYDQEASLLCRVVKISRHDLTLLGTGTGCIAIRWKIASDLAEGIQHTTVTNTLLQELAEQRVVQIGNES